MKQPEKFYRIFQIEKNGTIHLFETNQFGEPNNWFTEEQEAEEWIKEIFVDAHPGIVSNFLSLVIIPVFTITFKHLDPNGDL